MSLMRRILEFLGGVSRERKKPSESKRGSRLDPRFFALMDGRSSNRRYDKSG